MQRLEANTHRILHQAANVDKQWYALSPGAAHDGDAFSEGGTLQHELAHLGHTIDRVGHDIRFSGSARLVLRKARGYIRLAWAWLEGLVAGHATSPPLSPFLSVLQ